MTPPSPKKGTAKPLDNPRVVAAFRRALLDWYDANRRSLPWRQTRDPYAIWISEIMLQQTTVRTVESRWRRFLARFPTIAELANAPLDDVLNEWTGLGYYARARNLHAAAIRVRDDFGGELPRRFELLIALPGMGRYTASAVASIAFGEEVAVLDANVERVLARLLAEDGDVRATRTKARLWEVAQRLLAHAAPGDWNQAMMELGAMVCLPKAPQCGGCPVGKWCEARATGTPERFPVKAPKPEMESVREVAVVIRRGAKVLVLRRPDKGSFAGMWETPRGVVGDSEQSRDAVVRLAREQAGVEVEPRLPVMEINHVVMRRKIRLGVWEARVVEGRATPSLHDEHEWIDPEEWLARPISTTQRRIARYLLGLSDEVRKPKSASDSESESVPDLFSQSDS